MTEQKRVAFLTLSDPSGFFIYDRMTFEPLHDLGWSVEEIPWDLPGVDWQGYDAVVIRSTWDYQNRTNDFLGVLDSITQAGTQLLNSVDLVRWNLQKSYLRNLEQKGIPIVPTEWLDRLSNEQPVLRFFDMWEADAIVIKPLVGANADDTFLIKPDGFHHWQKALLTFARRACLVQPFIETIIGQGEYSLFYFGGQYSHCVVKRPASGDFRVQEEHGGTISACVPSDQTQEIGDQVIAALPEETLYARVDLVVTSTGQWNVMEVELIEPSLYFPYDEESPKRFAIALDRKLRLDARKEAHIS